MSSLLTPVFNATIGFVVRKGRDAAADKLKEGDITEQKLRDMIVREIHDVKSKLDGLARKDLLAAIDYFEEGIELFYAVVNSKISSPSNAEAKAISLTKIMKSLKVSDLDESTTNLFSNAKKRFEDARRKATDAFNDEALETSDRVMAMGYRVMATILETVDNPSEALPACRLCIERLHSLPAVQSCFTVEFKKGFRGHFSKDERREIFLAVCRLNRVVYDVTFLTYGFGNRDVSSILQMWPCVELEKGSAKVNPLQLFPETRVAKTLSKLGMTHFCLQWSFGQDGEEEHKMKDPWGIATNSDGHFIVADLKDGKVKVYDESGKFLYSFCPVTDDTVAFTAAVFVHDVATDKNDNIYVLVTLKKPGAQEEESYVYAKTSNGVIPLREGFKSWSWTWSSLAVNDSEKVLVRGEVAGGHHVVDIYKADGKFVRRFGERKLKEASAIAAANDGCAIVADDDDGSYRINVFREKGKRICKFNVQATQLQYHQATFHQASQHVVVAGIEREGKKRLQIYIYTKDGEFVRSIESDEEDIVQLRGITVTMDGRTAAVYKDKTFNFKVLVV